MKYLFFIVVMHVIGCKAFSQTGTPAGEKPVGVKPLPGKGLEEHDFFYAGEGKIQNMYIVRKGQIAWEYKDTATKGEISDAVLLANGNILFAHQYGITLINADKKILWRYIVPKGHEVHTAQPIGKKYVVFVQNGDTAKVIVMNIRENKIVKEFTIPVGNPQSVHGQFRHARLTNKGTLLVSHMDMGKVCEYDINGKQLSSIAVPGVWGAESMANGNIITCGKGIVSIFSPNGDTLWNCITKDIPGYTMVSTQLAFVRPNGNIVVNDWFNQWSGKPDTANLPVQFIELTPGKKIVWALSSWKEPFNLGPATTIQFLDEKRISEKVFFGNIK